MHAAKVSTLCPYIVRDPFDRLLITQMLLMPALQSSDFTLTSYSELTCLISRNIKNG